MSDNLEAPKHRFGSRTERREHPRQDVRAIAYVQLGDGNGGIIINISESGMALAAAEPIDHQDLPKIRFQLPQSADFIEVTGEITWQSDSRRRVGIKFMDLPERARTQIRSWISGEISSQKATVGAPGQDADQSSPVCHPLPSPGGPAARMHAPESMAGVAQPIIAASGNRPQWSGSSADPRFAEKQTPAIAGIDQPPRQERRESLVAVPRNGGEPAKAGEKRHYVRRDVAEVIYIELGAENGGLITNVSETGLAVQAAKVVAEDSIERMRFRLRDSDSWIDAAGKIVWRSKERRKQVGIQFVDLPEVARQIVAEWVALEGKRATAKNAENGERPVTAPVPDRQGANVAAVRSGANAAPILSEVTGVHIPTPAASHVPNTGRAGTQALPQFGQHAMPGATQERAPFRWGLFAVMIAVIAGLSFAAGMVFGPHAWRSSISKDTPPIARATPDPPQPTSNSTAVAPKSAAEPASRGSSGAASFENSINMPKPAQAPSPDRTASTLQNSASAGSLPGGQSKPEDLTPLNAARPTQIQARKHTGEPAEPLTTNVQPALPPSSAAISNEVAPKQVPRPANVLPSEATTHADSVAAATPGSTSTANQTPPTISHPVSSPILKGAVTINSRFRSIRVPPGFQGQTSQAGESLQIGQLAYSRTPIYPGDAVQQRIEGIVRLSATIGADGSVKNVAAISGPTALIPAAMDAVRSWRYGQSFLGTQAIEIQQDVTIVFRIVNSAPLTK